MIVNQIYLGDSEIKKIIRYDKDEAGGTPELIKYGEFTLNGTEYMVSESNYNHPWSFSPGVSLFIESDSEQEIQTLFDKLSADVPKYPALAVARKKWTGEE